MNNVGFFSPQSDLLLRDRESKPGWAFRMLRKCQNGKLDVNHPVAIEAAATVGHKRAVKFYASAFYTNSSSQDAMFRRVQGSFGCGKRR
jgi:hypothetical protein